MQIAKGHEGTKFYHQGRTPGVGLDCLGLLVLSVVEAGGRLNDYAQYGQRPNPEFLLEKLEEHAYMIPHLEEPGDIPLYWLAKPNRPQHFGIFDGIDSVTHTWAGVGKVVTSKAEELVKQEGWNLHTCWRLKDSVWQQQSS